jgi:hypothetical protein
VQSHRLRSVAHLSRVGSQRLRGRPQRSRVRARRAPLARRGTRDHPQAAIGPRRALRTNARCSRARSQTLRNTRRRERGQGRPMRARGCEWDAMTRCKQSRELHDSKGTTTKMHGPTPPFGRMPLTTGSIDSKIFRDSPPTVPSLE